ncbi:UDP-N-acetylglucosamine:LPS N-acetylglucosamine transferase [Pseudonocardia hierapolitana]|uniref:UDP-N-acetylglucosamine:LPS N-acetylglucosamine transferase n=1 Tax=Pseudonocardia hierapolitana TaxID=1128676 RepID=A0A561SYV5_9PSEU|nr:glycosyltransferase [Pseudonocardia hierapolitana]TWF80046.1 UDP-N-acetylglucosamine:LPS N-acetylglucosamine transferase [Pseudonocardia hierapolitana]
MQRVLFVYSTAGGGHQSVAKALLDATRREYPALLLAEEDFFRRVSLLRPLPTVYGWLTRNAVWLYDAIFRFLNRALPAARVVQILKAVTADAARRIVEEHQPDLIVITAPAVAHVFDHIRTVVDRPYYLAVVVTDLSSSLHRLWVCPGIDATIACDVAVLERLLSYGLNSPFEVLPFPVHSDFTRSEAYAARNASRVVADRPVILVTMGQACAGPTLAVVSALAEDDRKANIVVVTGRNRSLARRLRRRHGANLVIVGATNEMPRLMAMSDVIVTKGGSSTIMEAVAVGLPIIVASEVGIQESGIGRKVEVSGWGMYESDPAKAALAALDLACDSYAMRCRRVGRESDPLKIVRCLAGFLATGT